MKIAVTAVRIEIGILVVMVTGTEPARRSLDDRHSTRKECSCSRNIRQRRWCPPHLHWTHAIAHQHYAAAIGDMAAFAAAVAIDKMRRTLQSLVWFASATSVNRRTPMVIYCPLSTTSRIKLYTALANMQDPRNEQTVSRQTRLVVCQRVSQKVFHSVNQVSHSVCSLSWNWLKASTAGVSRFIVICKKASVVVPHICYLRWRQW